MKRILQVGASRKTMGGVSTVLKAWEKADFWKKYHCKWIETQDNRGVVYKLYYWVTSFYIALFSIPKYHIVHFHTTPGRSIIIQMPIFLLSIFFKKKIVVQLHVGNQLNDHINDSLFKWVLKKADQIVLLAYVWQNLLINKYGVDASKVKVIYNPAPSVASISSKEKYVLYLAYLVENKGYDIVIKAFSKAVQNHSEWRLVMAGTGEIEKARTMAKETCAGDRIEIKDWVEGREKELLWQHAGAYCMASYQEGFPMTVLEAWSYGTPLVTTPVGGLPDVLVNGGNALVFDFGDVDSLATQFNLLFSSEKLRTSLSNASITLAKEKFSIEAINETIDNFYSTFL